MIIVSWASQSCIPLIHQPNWLSKDIASVPLTAATILWQLYTVQNLFIIASTVVASAQLTLCSVRPPAAGVTAAGVTFTAEMGVLEIGVVGTGGTGGGVVGIAAAAAAGDGVSTGAGRSGCGGAATGDGGGFAAAAASPDIQLHSATLATN